MALETDKSNARTVGNYDLLEMIAEGGMGTVYKARQRDTGEIVALKIVPPHVAKNPILMKRFEQEYNAANLLDSPNIVRAVDFGYHGATPYLAMEFVEGESLGQRIERDGPIAESEAIRIIAQVAQGLSKAHKNGLIHRDVKPDNVLITSDGTAKVTDLGLVKELEADLNLTRTGRGLGTPHFMAPEQFRNAKNADQRCDIYSMAATLYMMVTGELPFKSQGPLEAWMKKVNNELMPVRELAPKISERLEWAIQRAMSNDPNQRPATCREFIEDLTGHSTRKITPLPGAPDVGKEIWYLVYKDEEGVMHTVKGSLKGIRRSLTEGLLGDASNIRASRAKTGPFEPLRSHPEFRDLVVKVTPTSAPCKGGATPTKGLPIIGRKPEEESAESIFSGAQTKKHETSSVVLRGIHKAQEPGASSVNLADLAKAGVPMINMGQTRHSPLQDIIRWLILVIVAAGAGAAGYYLLPMLPHVKLPF